MIMIISFFQIEYQMFINENTRSKKKPLPNEYFDLVAYCIAAGPMSLEHQHHMGKNMS